MSQLPAIDSEAAFATYRAARPDLRPLARAIGDRHGVAADEVAAYATGSVFVYRLGTEAVLKLFPPIYGAGASTEATALARVAGKLPIATPELIACGSQDGWPYVLMTQLGGQDLSSVWADIPVPNRVELARQMGGALRALHDIPCEDLTDLRVDWPTFVRAQVSTVAERQKALGAPWHWVQQIPTFLADADLSVGADGLALLQTEIMHVHTKVHQRGGTWALCGLFDFEPAMVAPPAYEFASVGLFFTRGDATLLRALLDAYGVPRSAQTASLQRRFAAMMLVHRYCNLRWFLEELPAPPESTFESLAATWWAL